MAYASNSRICCPVKAVPSVVQQREWGSQIRITTPIMGPYD